MAMKQQFGRAGRGIANGDYEQIGFAGSRKSISFLVAFDSALDQYCVNHGALILQRYFASLRFMVFLVCQRS